MQTFADALYSILGPIMAQKAAAQQQDIENLRQNAMLQLQQQQQGLRQQEFDSEQPYRQAQVANLQQDTAYNKARMDPTSPMNALAAKKEQDAADERMRQLLGTNLRYGANFGELGALAGPQFQGIVEQMKAANLPGAQADVRADNAADYQTSAAPPANALASLVPLLMGAMGGGGAGPLLAQAAGQAMQQTGLVPDALSRPMPNPQPVPTMENMDAMQGSAYTQTQGLKDAREKRMSLRDAQANQIKQGLLQVAQSKVELGEDTLQFKQQAEATKEQRLTLAMQMKSATDQAKLAVSRMNATERDATARRGQNMQLVKANDLEFKAANRVATMYRPMVQQGKALVAKWDAKAREAMGAMDAAKRANGGMIPQPTATDPNSTAYWSAKTVFSTAAENKRVAAEGLAEIEPQFDGAMKTIAGNESQVRASAGGKPIMPGAPPNADALAASEARNKAAAAKGAKTPYAPKSLRDMSTADLLKKLASKVK